MTPYYSDDHVTIYHGDCRDIMPSLTFDVIVTDPPYGMALSSGRGGAFGDLNVANDHNVSTRDEALALAPFTPKLVFGRWSAPRPDGVRMVLTWEKGEHVGMGDLALPWKPNTEEVYVIGSGFVGRRGGCVLRYNAPPPAASQGRRHPTEKPVDLMRDLIGKCPPGVILDPFMGSGSTLRAAKDLGRKAIGIEVEERYCEIAAKRMAQEVLPL